MRFARSFRSAVAGVLAYLVLFIIFIAVTINSCVDDCSHNVSADETAGMAIQQDIPFGGRR